MKKTIILTIFALLIFAIILGGLWHINREKKIIVAHEEDFFIPVDSDLVLKFNSESKQDIDKLLLGNKSLFLPFALYNFSDSLITHKEINDKSLTLAFRKEGAAKSVCVFIFKCKSPDEKAISTYLQKISLNSKITYRRYNGNKIYKINLAKNSLFYSFKWNFLFLSNSDLYIEDCLKQNSLISNEDSYHSGLLNNIFSGNADLHMFIGNKFFEDLSKSMGTLSFNNKVFSWGTLDCDFYDNTISLSGFLDNKQDASSPFKLLDGQKAKEVDIYSYIPSDAACFSILNLSDKDLYFETLDVKRADLRKDVFYTNRKIEIENIIGNGLEKDFKNLFDGESAIINNLGLKGDSDVADIVLLKISSTKDCISFLKKISSADSQKPHFYKHLGKSYRYYKLPVSDLCTVWLGDFYNNTKSEYIMLMDNVLVLASSEEKMKAYINTYSNNYSSSDDRRLFDARMTSNFNFELFYNLSLLKDAKLKTLPVNIKKLLEDNSKAISGISRICSRFSNEKGMTYTSITAIKGDNNKLNNIKPDKFSKIHTIEGDKKVEREDKKLISGGEKGSKSKTSSKLSTNFVGMQNLSKLKLAKECEMKPVVVLNHVTKTNELLFQDNSSQLYLMSSDGKLLWKRKIIGRIVSEVYQVDAYKNGKLQYMFSTKSHLYLIDRNGKNVTNYPKDLSSSCSQGISIFDYDKTKNYRVFIPYDNGKIDLLDVRGNKVRGWNTRNYKAGIASKVEFFRVGNRDYIVYADKNRLHILDRRGGVRVNVPATFNLPSSVKIYLTKRNGMNVMAFTGIENFYFVDFAGKAYKLSSVIPSKNVYANVIDVVGSSLDELLISSDNKFMILNNDGKILYSCSINGESFPYVYKFSENDIRIGISGNDGLYMIKIKNGKYTIEKSEDLSSPLSIVYSNKRRKFVVYVGSKDASMISALLP